MEPELSDTLANVVGASSGPKGPGEALDRYRNLLGGNVPLAWRCTLQIGRTVNGDRVFIHQEAPAGSRAAELMWRKHGPPPPSDSLE